MEISTEIRANELHQKALAYYQTSENFAFKFVKELEKIRDEKLYKHLGFEDFEEYTFSCFGYSSRTINERIQTANSWGNEYERALASYGQHKTRQLGFLSVEKRKEVEEEGIETDEGIKTIEEATTREIEQYKKRIKQQDQLIQTKDHELRIKDNQLKDVTQKLQQEREPIVHYVEHVPDELRKEFERLAKRNEHLEDELNTYRNERQKVDEQSAKYKELTHYIQEAEGKLTDVQRKISSYKTIHDVLKESNNFLNKASSLLFMDTKRAVKEDVLAKRELGYLIDNLERFLKDLKNVTENNIIEGEIIDE